MSKIILFQGDSITDAGRNRERDDMRGRGYATMVSGELGLAYPEQYEFLNRGISGNRILDVYARIKADIINLRPDYMSLLIGVNDVWHEFIGHNGVSTDKFEKIYSMLIEEIKEALPDIKIMILEPFALKGSATTSTEEYEDLYTPFRADVLEKAAAARRVAEKFGLPFIELQSKFDAVYNPEFPDYWLFDGVHPSAAGHALITKEWIKTFEAIR
ncbi:MAG: SGNH/GDSL hydrolase family protein [Oscillospiraceae bacterium]|nr:SGNH/GDSL hydrolase family protein [Oscillospiraceae bacterium]